MQAHRHTGLGLVWNTSTKRQNALVSTTSKRPLRFTIKFPSHEEEIKLGSHS